MRAIPVAMTAVACLSLLTALHREAVASSGRENSTGASPKKPVMILEHGSDPAHATIVIRLTNATYRVRDETYSTREPDGTTYVFNSGEEAYYAPEFHLSPHQDWLLVERKGARRISFGYLYRRTSAGFIPVHVEGKMRLDEAAWRYAARKADISAGPMSEQRHGFFFDGWSRDPHQIRFHLVSGKDEPDLNPAIEVSMVYDLDRGAFRVLSRKDDESR